MKLQADESVIHELRPEPKLLAFWFFAVCVPIAAAGGMIGFFVTSMATKAVGPGIAAGVGVGTLVLLTVLAYSACLRRTYVYYVTDQRCVFRGGILRRIERSVPYHKITDVERSQNIIERVLGISTLNIFTPGTASTGSGGRGAEISFPGLLDSEAPAVAINGIVKSLRSTGE